MSWKSIACEESDYLRDAARVVLSGSTSRESGMYREWGDADGRPILKENIAYGDVYECSHWKWIEEEA